MIFVDGKKNESRTKVAPAFLFYEREILNPNLE